MSKTDRGSGKRESCHYPIKGGSPVKDRDKLSENKIVVDYPVVAVTSKTGSYIFGIAWPQPGSVFSNADLPCVHVDPVLPPCPPRKRVHVQGNLYLMEGTLDDLLLRVQREILPLEK